MEIQALLDRLKQVDRMIDRFESYKFDMEAHMETMNKSEDIDTCHKLITQTEETMIDVYLEKEQLETNIALMTNQGNERD